MCELSASFSDVQLCAFELRLWKSGIHAKASRFLLGGQRDRWDFYKALYLAWVEHVSWTEQHITDWWDKNNTG